MNLPFYNRVEELALLMKMFKEESLNGKSFECVITGQKNSGKTGLVSQFIQRISSDILISSRVPEFNADKNVVTFQCDKKSSQEPYSAFIFITNQILENQKKRLIYSKLLKIILTFSGIDSTLSAMVELSQTLKNSGDKDITKEEIARFKNYTRFLSRVTRKTPIIFYIKDVQYLDFFSLKLIENVVENPASFCGALIFEMNDSEGDSYDAVKFIRDFINTGKIKRINLSHLDQGFPRKMLSPVFGENTFSESENYTLFANSKGLPGNLVNLVTEYQQNGWLYFEDGKWVKAESFEEKIKPKKQQLIDVLILSHADGEISESEMNIAKSMAIGWGFKNEDVHFCVNMVTSIAKLGYRFERFLPWGLLSEYVFQVRNQNDELRIVEYLQVNPKELPPRRNSLIQHVNIVEAKAVRQFDDSILIEWDYFEGKRMRELLIEINDTHLENCLRLLKQVISGLNELHKYNIIHNYITPEAIIESNDGSYKLATLDSNLIGFLKNNCKSIYDDSIYYSAPELFVEGKPTTRSDIYSIGILLYNLITNSLPFSNLHPAKAKDQIIRNNLDFIDLRGFRNYEALVAFFNKCLRKNPNERFANLDELLVNLEKLADGLYIDSREEIKEKSTAPASEPVNTRLLEYLLKSAAGVLLVVIVYFAFFYSNSLIDAMGGKKDIDQIVVDISIGQDSADFGKPVVKDVVEYLMEEEILRSANLSVLSGSQFKRLREANGNMTLMPRLWIKGSVTRSSLGYELGLSIVDNGSTIKEKKISFTEPSTFLTGEVKPLVTEILRLKKIPLVKNIPITDSWDAVENFVVGINAWYKLDKTTAKSAFGKAISFDPNYTQAKLKYFEVLQFEGGSTTETDSLMKDLKTSLSTLSPIDSIRVLAVEKKTQGKFRESIPYYRQIAEKLPQNKYSFYEIAGAYNQFRDDDNAIEYYLKALERDTNYALALNHLAYSYMNKFEVEKAFYCFRRYVELDNSANAYDGLADCFFSAGMVDSAIYYKAKGISIDPNLEYLYSGMGLFYTLNRNYEKASLAFNNFATLVKGNEELSNKADFYMAFNNYSANRLAEAQSILNKVSGIADKPAAVLNFPEILWLRGMISFESGDYKTLEQIVARFKDIISKYGFSKEYYNPVYKYYVFLEILDAIGSNNSSKLTGFIDILNKDLKFKVKDNGSVFDYAFFSFKLFQIFSSSEFKDEKAALMAKNSAISANPFYAKFAK